MAVAGGADLVVDIPSEVATSIKHTASPVGARHLVKESELNKFPNP